MLFTIETSLVSACAVSKYDTPHLSRNFLGWIYSVGSEAERQGTTAIGFGVVCRVFQAMILMTTDHDDLHICCIYVYIEEKKIFPKIFPQCRLKCS